MEKENQHYSTIESIIKKHKKFPGLESIMDDIIEDVYSHAEVILRTVTNENVINAYLEKIVSTSIITVPKKLGLKSQVGTEVKSSFDTSIINKTSIDPMINSTDSHNLSPLENVSVSEEKQEQTLSTEDFENTMLLEDTSTQNLGVQIEDEFVTQSEIQSEESGIIESKEEINLISTSVVKELNTEAEPVENIQEEQVPESVDIEIDKNTCEQNFDNILNNSSIQLNDNTIIELTVSQNSMPDFEVLDIKASNIDNSSFEELDNQDDRFENLESVNNIENSSMESSYLIDNKEDNSESLEFADNIENNFVQDTIEMSEISVLNQTDEELQEVTTEDIESSQSLFNENFSQEHVPTAESIMEQETSDIANLSEYISSDDTNDLSIDDNIENNDLITTSEYELAESNNDVQIESFNEENENNTTPVKHEESSDLFEEGESAELQLEEQASRIENLSEPLVEPTSPDVIEFSLDNDLDDISGTITDDEFSIEAGESDLFQEIDSSDLNLLPEEPLDSDDMLELDAGDYSDFEIASLDEEHSEASYTAYTEPDTIIDYSMFNFEPETDNLDATIDADLVIKDLETLAHKNTELDILKIYNLKYKENQTIPKIASDLQISEEQVIDALNEIIAVI